LTSDPLDADFFSENYGPGKTEERMKKDEEIAQLKAKLETALHDLADMRQQRDELRQECARLCRISEARVGDSVLEDEPPAAQVVP
jgi:chromosome segregation ATPase